MATPIALTSTKTLSRKDWLAWRRTGLGSSDAAAILGLSQYASPLMVYMDKLGLLPEQESNLAMELGVYLEDFVAKKFSEATGWSIRRRNAILQHREFHWMLANLDREFRHPVHGSCPLEIKTTSEWLKDDWRDGKAPFAAQIQLQHQLAVTGATFGCLAVLVGNREFKYLEMPRDDELINTYLIPAEAAFWRRVQEENPPDWMGLESEEELLKAMYPQAETGKEVDLPHEAVAWQKDYWYWHGMAKQAEAEKTAAACRIKAAIGDAEIGYAGTVLATYKTINAERFDQAGFQEAHPALFAEWKRPAPYRRLDVKKGV